MNLPFDNIGSVIQKFEDEWNADRPINFIPYINSLNKESGKLCIKELILSDIELRCQKKLNVDINIYIEMHGDVILREKDVIEVIGHEIACKIDNGIECDLKELASKYPQFRDLVAKAFEKRVKNDSESSLAIKVAVNSYKCKDPIPEKIGHYRILQILGTGNFGRVFLALDLELGIRVAIKVPRKDRILTDDDLEVYRKEARTVASLEDIKGIVPVKSVGEDSAHPFFVVSKYIEGETLEQRLKSGLPEYKLSANIVSCIARSLHQAHGRGVFHRDLKTANILLDEKNNPWVLDFGLALREEEIGKSIYQGGTPFYMSPEQAKKQGHRVDGRTDIFSLGVMFYEMLSGKRPFQGATRSELFDQIIHMDPRPLRARDENIPKELERICLKALSKQIRDRYPTAKEMAEDLESWLHSITQVLTPTVPYGQTVSAQSSSVVQTVGIFSDLNPSSRIENQNLITTERVIPKGLRAFDEMDAGFFLNLLPGVRGRDGLPESIRFWKSRIESKQASFTIGLLFGPSGCGKSSLVKAGLIPRLDPNKSATIYIESAPGQTESRLLFALKRLCDNEESQTNLSEQMFQIRQRRLGPSGGKRLVIVLDQFEQWLNERQGNYEGELLEALGQCDGDRALCILLVRDDFAMGISRFMQALEVEIRPDENYQIVDLFDQDHSLKVLTILGQGYARLPENSEEINTDQKYFLQQSISCLAQENRVISVKLALFSQMMRNRDWVPGSLKDVGGLSGLGIAFLEENLTGKGASPDSKFYSKAIIAFLRELLPEIGTDIKGAMKSTKEIQKAIGFEGKDGEFETVLRILDRNLRLVTPTDHESFDEKSMNSLSAEWSANKQYQLTHDYLVPSLRQWLKQKQDQTWSGRAKTLLTELTAIWSLRKEKNHLPSMKQWVEIRLLTSKQKWNTIQKEMMREGAFLHGFRALMMAMLLIFGISGVFWAKAEIDNQKMAFLCESLTVADTSADALAIIKKINIFRPNIDELLYKNYDDAVLQSDKKKELHFLLALYDEKKNKEKLFEFLLSAHPKDLPAISSILFKNENHEEMREYLIDLAANPTKGKESARLRAVAALAILSPPEDPRWLKVLVGAAEDFVTAPTFTLHDWITLLEPIKTDLVVPLEGIFIDSTRKDTERSLAAEILAEFTENSPQELSRFLVNSEKYQYHSILKKCEKNKEDVKKELKKIISENQKKPDLNWDLKFYKWNPEGKDNPPKNWSEIIKSKPIYQSKRKKIDFQFGNFELLDNQIPQNYFAAQAETKILVPKGEYEITIFFDDGVRIWFDDKVILEKWGFNHGTTETVKIVSDGNHHRIIIDYFQIEGGYAFKVDFNHSFDSIIRFAKNQANAVVALAIWKEIKLIMPFFERNENISVYNEIISRLKKLVIDKEIVKEIFLNNEALHNSATRGIILAMGEYDERDLENYNDHDISDRLKQLYSEHPDSGIHAAAEWTLRKWGYTDWILALENKWKTASPINYSVQVRPDGSWNYPKSFLGSKSSWNHWFINSSGMTFSVHPGGTYYMTGSNIAEKNRDEKERNVVRRLQRPLAFSTKCITRSQYLKLQKTQAGDQNVGNDPDLPITGIDWYMAATFCNRLSKAEGIPYEQWCYNGPENAESVSIDNPLKQNFFNLSGYRLPSNWEWEFMARAGTQTPRFFGESVDLLDSFSWYESNSINRVHQVGLKKPNDFGLFDVYGNCFCWCQDFGTSNNFNFISTGRGGSFSTDGGKLRSASWLGMGPSQRPNDFGIRICRSLEFFSEKDRIGLSKNQPVDSLGNLIPGAIMRLEGHSDKVNVVKFSPDGKYLISGGDEGRAILWDLDSGQIINTFKGHDYRLISLDFHPSEKKFITGGRDHKAIEWSFEGKKLQVFNHTSRCFHGVLFDKDGKNLLTGSCDGTLQLIDLKSAKNIYTIKENKSENFDFIEGFNSIVCNNDFSLIVTAGERGTVSLWDPRTRDKIRTFQGLTDSCFAVAISPDGTKILAGGEDPSVIVWNVANGKKIKELKANNFPSQITSINFDTSGNRVVTSSVDGSAVVWDLNEGRVLYRLKGHIGSVNYASFSSDGKRIVTCGSDGTILIWDCSQFVK